MNPHDAVFHVARPTRSAALWAAAGSLALAALVALVIGGVGLGMLQAIATTPPEVIAEGRRQRAAMHLQHQREGTAGRLRSPAELRAAEVAGTWIVAGMGFGGVGVAGLTLGGMALTLLALRRQRREVITVGQHGLQVGAKRMLYEHIDGLRARGHVVTVRTRNGRLHRLPLEGPDQAEALAELVHHGLALADRRDARPEARAAVRGVRAKR